MSVLAGILLATLASAGTIEWNFPRLGNCHEGLAFSDGVTGVLVWGGGDELRLTVGRADLWDHRGGYPWTAEQSYTNIVSLWRAGEEKKLLGLFRNEPPANWGGRYNPYMLPLGRVVMKLGGGGTLMRGELDPFSGLGKLFLSGGKTIDLAMSKKSRAFALRLPEGVSCELKSVPATDFGVYEQSLKPRGFEKAVVFDGQVPDCGGFRWKLPADEPAWLTWGRKGRECVVMTGRGEVGAECLTPRASFGDVRAESVAQWEKFWAEGARVKVPDPVLQRIYDYGMYRFGAMTDPDGVPAGLQGPWLEDDRLVPWNGDYHFNINVQECYSPAFRGGHFAHLMPLFRMILSWRPRLRDNARKFCGIDDGYVMPHSVDDRGVCIGGFWTGTIDHASTAWMASFMFRYVKYSGDAAFLKADAYEFMKGAMNVYLAMMEEKDGALALPLGPSPEWMGADFRRAVGRNPSFQLAACHRLAKDLIAAAEMLGEKPDSRWLDVERRLPAFARVTKSTGDKAVWGAGIKDGIAIFEGVNLHESHRHHSHMAGIYPFDTIPRAKGENREMLDATYGNWALRGTGLWTGWCVPWASILHTDAGNTSAAVQMLHAWDAYFCDEGHGSHHNAVWDGFTNFRHGRGVMQMDGQCAAATAVLELLAHERDGKVEFFRGCPAEWKDVSFENLALSDGRRVSGRRLNGVVTVDVEGPTVQRAASYWCTWETQNYTIDPARQVKTLGFVGDQGSQGARDNIDEDVIFGKGGWIEACPPETRRHLYFLIDDGWDVPYHQAPSKDVRPFGTLVVDAKRFPTFSGTPAERLAKFNRAVMARGWKGLALWCSTQCPGEDWGNGKAGRKAVRFDEATVRKVWREKLGWIREAGVGYLKFDWGARGSDISFRRIISELAAEIAPGTIVEHCTGAWPLNEPERMIGNPKYDDNRRRAKELMSFSHIFRIYDLLNPFVQATAVERMAFYLDAQAEAGGTCVLSSEDAVYLGTSLGSTFGVMRSSYLPDARCPVIEQNRRMTEVDRAVAWQRLAPPFASSEKPRWSEKTLTDTWFFKEGEGWYKKAQGHVTRQQAPAVIARGMELPEVKGMEADGDVPFVTACRYANGCVSVGTTPRMDEKRGLRCPKASIRLSVTPTKLAVFGRVGAVSFPSAAKRLFARDLAGGEPEEITAACACENGFWTIPGDLLNRIGTMKNGDGDRSDPGTLITFEKKL